MNGSKVYAAIRETEGRLWIDVSSVRVLPELTREHCDDMEQRIPDWAAVNRLVRIAELTLSEGIAPPPAPPAPVVAPVKPKAKRGKGPIIIDGLDCTDAIREMEKARSGWAMPNTLLNPMSYRKDKRTSERLAAAMDGAEKYGETVTVPCEDGGTIVVRRRPS
jgi:hypothetical protein